MVIPTVVLPYVNAAMAMHPVYGRSLERLGETGVLVGSCGRTGRRRAGANRFRWEEALELLEGEID